MRLIGSTLNPRELSHQVASSLDGVIKLISLIPRSATLTIILACSEVPVHRSLYPKEHQHGPQILRKNGIWLRRHQQENMRTEANPTPNPNPSTLQKTITRCLCCALLARYVCTCSVCSVQRSRHAGCNPPNPDAEVHSTTRRREAYSY